jgi:hypothetical protein
MPISTGFRSSFREESGAVISQPRAVGFMLASKRSILQTGYRVTFMLPVIVVEAEKEIERLAAVHLGASVLHGSSNHHVPVAACAIGEYCRCGAPTRSDPRCRHAIA